MEENKSSPKKKSSLKFSHHVHWLIITSAPIGTGQHHLTVESKKLHLPPELCNSQSGN